jgi:hypothetical protein
MKGLMTALCLTLASTAANAQAIDAGLTTIDGTWNQLGNSLPLSLKRVR